VRRARLTFKFVTLIKRSFNPAHDLIRLGLSLASAARGSDLPGIVTVKMIENMVEGYEQAFANADKNFKYKIARPQSVKAAMNIAVS